jgi:ABC-2 type transport system ATP-binding protein
MEEIRIHKLSKEYYTSAGVVAAVRDLSLSIARGSVFGFLGPNGAGKTTTMKMLVGLAEPTSGEIKIGGGSPTEINVRRSFGFMPESPAFYLYLTGAEFLQFIADIFSIKESKPRINAVLDTVGLTGAEDRQIRTYSKGMLQRLGLAQALINEPDILFLDEPLDGLDPLGRAEVKQIFGALRKQGKTIFFNSHILADVAELCDTVGIIDKGTLIAFGAPATLSKGYRDLEDAFVHIINEKRKSEKESETTPLS